MAAMAHSSELYSSALSHLQQIRSFISNAKDTLTRLLAASNGNEESMERVQELRQVLQDLKQQERTYVELLDEYSNVQSMNRILRDRLSDSFDARPYAASSSGVANNKQRRLAELQRTNNKFSPRGRGQLDDLTSESERAVTPTERTESEADSENQRYMATWADQSKQPKLAALREYEQSLVALRMDIQERLRAAAARRANNSGAASELQLTANDTGTDASFSSQIETETETETDDTSIVGSTRRALRDRLCELEEKRNEVESMIQQLRLSAPRNQGSSSMPTSSRLGSSLVESTSLLAQSAVERTRAARASANETLVAGAELLELLNKERRERGKRRTNSAPVPPIEVPSRSSVASSQENSDVAANFGATRRNIGALLADGDANADRKAAAAAASATRQMSEVREKFRELEVVRERVQRQQALLSSIRQMQSGPATFSGVYKSPELLALTNEILSESMASDNESEAQQPGRRLDRPDDSNSLVSTETETGASTSSDRQTLRMQDSVVLTKERLRAMRRNPNLGTIPDSDSADSETRRLPIAGDNRSARTRFSEPVRTFGIDLKSFDSTAKRRTDDSTTPKTLKTAGPPAKEPSLAERVDMMRVERELDRELERERASGYQRVEEDAGRGEQSGYLRLLREQAAQFRHPDPDSRPSKTASGRKPAVGSDPTSESDSCESVDQLAVKRQKAAARLAVPRYRQTNLRVGAAAEAAKSAAAEASELERLAAQVRSTSEMCESLARGQQRLGTLLSSLSSNRQTQTPTPTPTPTPTLTLARPASVSLAEPELYGMLISMQQQMLSQQYELQLMRQQFGAPVNSNPISSGSGLALAAGRDEQLCSSSLSNSTSSASRSMSAFDALRERIYSEVVALISANEKRPQFMVEVFRGLQKLQTDGERQRLLQTIHETALNRAQQNASFRRNGESSAPPVAETSTRRKPAVAAAKAKSYEYDRVDDRRASVSCSESSSSQQRFVEQLEAKFDPRLHSSLHSNAGVNASLIAAASYMQPSTSTARQVADDAASDVTSTNTAETYDLPFADDPLCGTVIEQHMRSMMKQSHASATADRAAYRPQQQMRGNSGSSSSSVSSFDSGSDSPSDTGGARPLSAVQQASAVDRTDDSGSDSDDESDGQTLERLVDESLRAVDTPQLDAFIKTLIGDLISTLRGNLDQPFSIELRGIVRRFVVRASARLTDACVDADADAFTRQLDSVVEECLSRYDARHLRDCCEDMLVDLSELLFNELAFFRVVQSLDRRRGDMVDDEVTLRRGAPSASLRCTIREQLGEGSHAARSSTVETDDDELTVTVRSAPINRICQVEPPLRSRSATYPNSGRSRPLDTSGLSSEHDDIETLSRRLGFLTSCPSASASSTFANAAAIAVAERDSMSDESRSTPLQSASDDSDSERGGITVDAVTGELVANDRVRIELAVSETKPYSRVVRSEEDGDTGSELADDTDADADAYVDRTGVTGSAFLDDATAARKAKRGGAQRYIVTAVGVGRDEHEHDDDQLLALDSSTGYAAVGVSQFEASLSSNGALLSSMVLVGEHGQGEDTEELLQVTLTQNGDSHREGRGNGNQTRFDAASSNGATAIARDREMLSRMYDESFSVAESSENELLPPGSTGNNAQAQRGAINATNGVLASNEAKLDDNDNVRARVGAGGEDEDGDGDGDEAVSFDDLNKDATQEKQVRSQLEQNQNEDVPLLANEDEAEA